MGRVDELFLYDEAYYDEGIEAIAGVDEVGRGPVAGDVYAVCAVMNRHSRIEGVDDSKKLGVKKREFLFKQIQKEAVCYAVGIASVHEIDTLNIRNATLLAMKRAVLGLKVKPDLVLVDGNMAPDVDIPCKPVVGGDRISYHIACASILAKVERDSYMKELDGKYPGYGFAKNAGYGTKEHKQGLLDYGVTPIHRKMFTESFLKNETSFQT